MNPFRFAFVYNGRNFERELARINEMIFILEKIMEETMNFEERFQLDQAIRDLIIQKNILLQNMLMYIHDFWMSIRTVKKLICPHCGNPFFLKYLDAVDPSRLINHTC